MFQSPMHMGASFSGSDVTIEIKNGAFTVTNNNPTTNAVNEDWHYSSIDANNANSQWESLNSGPPYR